MIPDNISKEHLLKAIEKINIEGIPLHGDSTYYDVWYEGKRYPPKLIVSYANLYANDKVLDRNNFKGGREQRSFKLLKQYGFKIIGKNEIPSTMSNEKFSPELKKFLVQSASGNLKTKHFSKTFCGLKVKVSFGQGTPARIPWISFTQPPNTTMNGIYPVYLYYKSNDILILSYGISETNKPSINWNFSNEKKTISNYFKEKGLGTPERYGASHVFKIYDSENLPPEEILDSDLNIIIEEYKNLYGDGVTPSKKSSKPLSSEQNKNEEFDWKKFKELSERSGLIFSDYQITRLVGSLTTKPFTILTGLSGSGKTKLAQAFAHWICEIEEQYCIVPVGADWTNREPLLGYPNALDNTEYVKPENGFLDLLIRASKNKGLPHFLILDEMNLSHVERYFADFLSIMETNSSIALFTDESDKNGIPSKIEWPSNLFIIGTVNIDETTYMFSPKVLDRANTIEFRINDNEMQEFLKNHQKPALSFLKAKGASMAQSFLSLSKNKSITPDERLNEVLLKFFKELKKTGTEFGYRSASEIYILISQLQKINEDLKENELIDIAIMQKMLPKLHGSRRKLCPTLISLAKLCVNNPEIKVEKEIFEKYDFDFMNSEFVKYPLSLEKLSRMYNGAVENGFASYAEA